MRTSTAILSIAVLCLLASAMPTTEAARLTVWGYALTQSPSLRILTNVVAYPTGSSTPILATYTDNFGMWVFAHLDLPEGTYDIVVVESGFYRLTQSVTITSSSTDQTFPVYLVPVSPGVTIVNEPLLGQIFYYFMPSLALPSTAGFSTTHISPISSSTDYGPYNFGTPPASIMSSYWTIVLNAANAGTYRLYSDSWTLLETVGFPPINFTLSAGLHMSVYAGLDAATGFVGRYAAQQRSEKNWYVGDLIVTNPSFGCSTYRWQTVDTYGNTPDFDQTNHGSGTLIGEQCVDTSPAALACQSSIYPPSVETVTCGAFGDPHVIMFDGVGVTCGYDPVITLLDNEHISITAETTFLNTSNNATAIESITLTYKGYCNPTSVTFNSLANIESQPFNSPNAYHYGMHFSGNNAYIDALHLRLQVRRDESGAVLFGISIPRELAEASTGICVNSCPAGTLINEASAMAKRSSSEMKLALDACSEAGLTPGSFEYQACLFDVSSTSNTDYAADAASISTIRAEVGTAWDPANIPNPSAPTGAASAALPSLLALGFACLIAFIL